ncbi:MAG: hypothetical protein EZS28_040132, partial [Streblomastix strix]
ERKLRSEFSLAHAFLSTSNTIGLPLPLINGAGIDATITSPQGGLDEISLLPIKKGRSIISPSMNLAGINDAGSSQGAKIGESEGQNAIRRGAWGGMGKGLEIDPSPELQENQALVPFIHSGCSCGVVRKTTEGHTFSPFEFVSSLANIRLIPSVMDSALEELLELYKPRTTLETLALQCAYLDEASFLWKDIMQEMNKASNSSTSQSSSIITSQQYEQQTQPNQTPSLIKPEDTGNKQKEKFQLEGICSDTILGDPIAICASVDTFLTLIDGNNHSSHSSQIQRSQSPIRTEQKTVDRRESQIHYSSPLANEIVTNSISPKIEQKKTEQSSDQQNKQILNQNLNKEREKDVTFLGKMGISVSEFAAVVAYTHTLEAVRLRQEIFIEHNSRRILSFIYQRQAACIGLFVRTLTITPPQNFGVYKFEQTLGLNRNSSMGGSRTNVTQSQQSFQIQRSIAGSSLVAQQKEGDKSKEGELEQQDRENE